jgi:hypothetical protein
MQVSEVKRIFCETVSSLLKKCPSYYQAIPLEEKELEITEEEEPQSPSTERRLLQSSCDLDLEFDMDIEMDDSSDILSKQDIKELKGKLPALLKFKDLKLLYSLHKDGASFMTFGNQVCNAGPVIIAIQLFTGQVIGVFVGNAIKKTINSFSGNSDTFVFKTKARGNNNQNNNNMEMSELEVFKTADPLTNRCFLHFSGNSLSVGGGGDNYHAIWIGEHLREGSSYPCDTFKSPPLVNGADIKGYFKISNVEVFGFDNNF